MKTGGDILNLETGRTQKLVASLQATGGKSGAYDRKALVHRFSFKLLEAEKSGSVSVLFHGGSDSKHTDDGPVTGCGEFRAVATTVLDDGKQIVAAGGADSIVYVWDVADKNHLMAALQLMPGRSGELDLQSKLLSTAHPLTCTDKSRGPAIMSLSFSPHGKRLAISTGTWGNQEEKGHVLLWDLENDPPIDLPADFKGAADSTAFSSDGKFLVASGEDDNAEKWSLSGMKVVGKPEKFGPGSKDEPQSANVRLRVGNGANAVALSSPAAT